MRVFLTISCLLAATLASGCAPAAPPPPGEAAPRIQFLKTEIELGEIEMALQEPDNAIDLKLEQSSTTDAVIHVRWRLPATAGRRSRTLNVRCSAPQPRELAVPISAWVTAAGAKP